MKIDFKNIKKFEIFENVIFEKEHEFEMASMPNTVT